MWVTQPKKTEYSISFLNCILLKLNIIVMKKKKSKNSIEEIRKNSKWLKLFENIPYNNSKVGQTFIMKVSSRKNPKS
tara:strand:+ start:190 stop:420 length:231 start_codon:yes stop_codon:yes gene_type:complete